MQRDLVILNMNKTELQTLVITRATIIHMTNYTLRSKSSWQIVQININILHSPFSLCAYRNIYVSNECSLWRAQVKCVEYRKMYF